jgi:PAS domain S-box-containing protein
MLAEWQALAEWIGIAAGAIVGVKVLWTLLKKGWGKVGSMFGLGEIKTDIGCLAQKLDFIVAELHPNGGASIRDSLNRIELRQVLQEQRQRAILSDMSIGVFETNVAGHCVWANRKYLRITGRTFEEVEGTGWINILAHGDRDRIIKSWDASIKEEREFEEVCDIVSPDGGVTHCRVQSYKMSDENDTIGYLGMLTPINKEGRREKANY